MLPFNERLRLLRSSKNLMAKDVANVLGITYRNYQRYENGAADPALSKMLVLADYFGVSLDYLIGRSDEPNINNERK